MLLKNDHSTFVVKVNGYLDLTLDDEYLWPSEKRAPDNVPDVDFSYEITKEGDEWAEDLHPHIYKRDFVALSMGLEKLERGETTEFSIHWNMFDSFDVAGYQIEDELYDYSVSFTFRRVSDGQFEARVVIDWLETEPVMNWADEICPFDALQLEEMINSVREWIRICPR